MKKIILIFTFIIVTNHIFGQSIVWEVLNLGYSFGITKDNQGYGWTSKGSPGSLTLGSELRMKLLDNRLSPGLQFAFSGWGRYNQDGDWIYHQFAASYMALCDYNFLKVHPKIVPFAGLAAGLSSVRNDDSVDIWTKHFAFSPRIGIELFKHLRIAAEYKYLGNRNNYFNIRVGFVIGS